MAKGSETQGEAGPATDRNNDPVVDPTRNVLDLVAAAISRQDDLRQMETAHVRELMALRAEFAKELGSAESARIDAIRAVDVGAVNRAAEVQAQQASTLAAQVVVSAETLRTQVSASDAKAETSLARALEPILTAVADLRRAQYETQGQKTQVIEARDTAADFKPMVDALAALALAQAESTGARGQVVETRAQSGNVGLWAGVAAAALFGFLMFAVAVAGLYAAFSR